MSLNNINKQLYSLDSTKSTKKETNEININEAKEKDICFKKYNILFRNILNVKKNIFKQNKENQEIDYKIFFIENDCDYQLKKETKFNNKFLERLKDIKSKKFNYNIKYLNHINTLILFCKNLLIVYKNNKYLEYELEDIIYDVTLNKNIDDYDYEFINLYKSSMLMIIGFKDYIKFYLIDESFSNPKFFDLNIKINLNKIFSIEFFEKLNQIIITNGDKKLLYIKNFKLKEINFPDKGLINKLKSKISLKNKNCEYKFKNKVYENFLFQLKTKNLIIEKKSCFKNQTIYLYKFENKDFYFFNKLKLKSILNLKAINIESKYKKEIENSFIIDFNLYKQNNITCLELIMNNLYVIKLQLFLVNNKLITEINKIYVNTFEKIKINTISMSYFNDEDLILLLNNNLLTFNRINYLSDIGKNDYSDNDRVKYIIYNNLTEICKKNNIEFNNIIQIITDDNDLKIILEDKVIILKKLNLKNMYFNIFTLIYKNLYNKENLNILMNNLNKKLYIFGLNYSLIIFEEVINEIEHNNNNLFLIDKLFNNNSKELLTYKNKENIINLIKTIYYQIGFFNEYHFNLIYEFLIMKEESHNSTISENLLLDVFKNNKNLLLISSFIESNLLYFNINIESILNKKLNDENINLDLINDVINKWEFQIKFYLKKSNNLKLGINVEFWENYKILELLKSYILKEYYDNDINKYFPLLLKNSCELLKIIYFLKKNKLEFILRNQSEIEPNLKFIDCFMNSQINFVVKKIYYNIIEKIDDINFNNTIDIFSYFLDKDEIESNKIIFKMIKEKNFKEFINQKNPKLFIQYNNLSHFLKHFINNKNLENFIILLKIRIESLENNSEIEEIIKFLILILIELDNSLKRDLNLNFFQKLKLFLNYLKKITYNDEKEKENKITFAKYFNKIEINDLKKLWKILIEILLSSTNKKLRERILKFILKKDSKFILISNLKTNISFDDYDIKNNFNLICNSQFSFDNINMIMNIFEKNKNVQNLIDFQELFINFFSIKENDPLHQNIINSKNIIINDFVINQNENNPINLDYKLIIISGILSNIIKFDNNNNIKIKKIIDELILVEKLLKLQNKLKISFNKRKEIINFMDNNKIIENKNHTKKFINYYNFLLNILDNKILKKETIKELITINNLIELTTTYIEFNIEEKKENENEFIESIHNFYKFSSNFDNIGDCFNLVFYFSDYEIIDFIENNINNNIKFPDLKSSFSFVFKNDIIYPFNILKTINLNIIKIDKYGIKNLRKLIKIIEMNNLKSFIISKIDIGYSSGFEQIKIPEYVFKDENLDNNLVFDPNYLMTILINKIQSKNINLIESELFDIYYKLMDTYYNKYINEENIKLNIKKIIYWNKNIIILLNIFSDKIFELIENIELKTQKEQDLLKNFYEKYDDIVFLLSKFNGELNSFKRVLSPNLEYLMLLMVENLTEKIKKLKNSRDYSNSIYYIYNKLN